MSQILHESDFISVDLGPILDRLAGIETPQQNNTKPKRAATSTKNEANLESLPNAGEWEQWAKLLTSRKKANDKLSSAQKQSEYAIESKFFIEFFNINFGNTTGDKLNLFGEPLKKAIMVLGFDPKKNPILGFINKQLVRDELINTGKLNTTTFKAIYNAVAKRLVAYNEFIDKPPEEYNIIYCPNLYDKPVEDIEKYLILQKEVLSSNSADKQVINKKVFLNITAIQETDLEKRAEEVNNWTSELPSIKTAILNSLTLARQISNKKAVGTIAISANEQDDLIGKLEHKTDLYAVLLYLSLSTDSTKVKSALSNDKLQGLDGAGIVKALMNIAENKIIPKGKLNNATADALTDKILAKLAEL